MIEIGVELATSHAFGRQFAEGFALSAAKLAQWHLKPIYLEDLSVGSLSRLQGVVMRVIDDSIENLARAAGTPVVDIYCDRRRPGFAQLCTDDARIGQLAAEFFLSKGFENFACYGIGGVHFSDERARAFEATLRAHGRAADFLYSRPTVLNGFSSAKPNRITAAGQLSRWLDRLPKPAAVFCCNDHLAYILSLAAVNFGLSVPNDVSILGADNDTLLCSFAPVPISSINVDAIHVGHCAAKMLHTILRTPPQAKAHRPLLIQPKGIVERESTSFSPIGPAWFSALLSRIENGLADGISTNDVIAASGYSSTHVERMFHAQLGKSVQAHISDLRLRKADALLRTTNLSVKEITHACGYSSPQYFCRVYRARFGTTPRHRETGYGR